jgi:hypothetical protein
MLHRPAGPGLRGKLGGFIHRDVGHDQAVEARLGGAGDERIGSAFGQQRHRDHGDKARGDLGADVRHRFKQIVHAESGIEGAIKGVLNDRSVGNGIGKGKPDLDGGATGLVAAADELHGGGHVRESRGQVGQQALAPGADAGVQLLLDPVL